MGKRTYGRLDDFDCEDCKKSIRMEDVYGRISYMNGLYGFWCKTCWENKEMIERKSGR